MSKTYRQVPHWASREPHTRKEFLIALGCDGARHYGSTHVAEPSGRNGYTSYDVTSGRSAAFNKRRASHINRRRGKKEVAKLLAEAIANFELDQKELNKSLESDLYIDWTRELDEWLDDHDYKFDPENRCECNYEEQAYCADRTCPNSRDWPQDDLLDGDFYDYDQDRKVLCTYHNAAQQAVCGNKSCPASAAHQEASP